MIYAALLPSGNDAAYALGEAVSGDMETFIALMNKTAKNIGCKKTHFTNPSGMQAKRHYTTASDMMEIVKVALSNDIIRKAAGSTKYTIEKTNKSKKEYRIPISSFCQIRNPVFMPVRQDIGIHITAVLRWVIRRTD